MIFTTDASVFVLLGSRGRVCSSIKKCYSMLPKIFHVKVVTDRNELVMMLQTDLFEIRGVHVAKGLSRHSMMSQDGQVVLS